MKKLSLALITAVFLLLTTFTGSTESVAQSPPPGYEPPDWVCEKLYHWDDYAGTGEPFTMCSGSPWDCGCDVVVNPDEEN